MPRPIILSEGELVCNGAFRFLHNATNEEKEQGPDSYKKYRCGLFECQQCSQHTVFLAPISRLLRGDIKHCPYCANKSRQDKIQKYHYSEGDSLDSSQRLIYLNEAGKDNSGNRLIKVLDKENNEEFIVRLSHILSGRTTKSPNAVNQERKERLKESLIKRNKSFQHRQSIQKYHPGDRFGLNNDIIFVKEISPHIEPSGKSRRRGLFYNETTAQYFESYIRSVVDGNTKGIKGLSLGEMTIATILEELNILYYQEYKFLDCINPDTGRVLPFDFYLPDYNCCIEYDGSQHFIVSENGWNNKENLERIQYRDSIKNEYCKHNNIRLIRIPYYQYSKINKQYVLHLIQDLDV